MTVGLMVTAMGGEVAKDSLEALRSADAPSREGHAAHGDAAGAHVPAVHWWQDTEDVARSRGEYHGYAA